MIQSESAYNPQLYNFFYEKPMNCRICGILINSSPITNYVQSKSMERICKIREFYDKDQNSFDFPLYSLFIVWFDVLHFGKKTDLLLKKGFQLHVKRICIMDSQGCQIPFSHGKSNPWSVGLS